MGRLIDGQWVAQKELVSTSGGRFVRADSSFRRWIRRDGSGDFPVARGRYHLYVSDACPWAHRTVIVRALAGLEQVISVSGVEPLMLDNGWELSERYPDPHHPEHRFLYQLYQRADPRYSGRVTVPVLWDLETDTIVNNESSEIIRMLHTEFAELGERELDLYPVALRTEIDRINDLVYQHVNNGVYRCGFARTQEAYDEAVRALFSTLDMLEARLAETLYLAGDRPTEADWRLYPTLVRFDPVYHGHFKCNLRRLRDYPNLLAHTRRLHQQPGIAELFDLDYTKLHYYGSHRGLNPHGVVPLGPAEHL